MGSGSHSPYREPDFPAGDLPSSPSLIDQRELDLLTAPLPVAGSARMAAWRPAVIEGGLNSRPAGAEMPGSVRPHPRRSGGRRVIHARAVVRIGLATAIMAALLAVVSIPRAGADRGPVPAVSHVVQPGDSLWSIAEQYTPATGDVRATIAVILSANEALSGFLAVGDVIEVPVEEMPGVLSGGSG